MARRPAATPPRCPTRRQRPAHPRYVGQIVSVEKFCASSHSTSCRPSGWTSDEPSASSQTGRSEVGKSAFPARHAMPTPSRSSHVDHVAQPRQITMRHEGLLTRSPRHTPRKQSADNEASGDKLHTFEPRACGFPLPSGRVRGRVKAQPLTAAASCAKDPSMASALTKGNVIFFSRSLSVTADQSYVNVTSVESDPSDFSS